MAGEQPGRGLGGLAFDRGLPHIDRQGSVGGRLDQRALAAARLDGDDDGLGYEAGQTTRGVDGDAATDRGGTAAHQLLGLALGAQPEMLVPVELENRGQVVHLGQGQILGADAGFGVGSVQDLVLEHPLRAGHHCGGIRCDIRQFGEMLRVLRTLQAHRPH